MDGHKYEYYCAKMLKKKGFYGVEVTKGSGDQGVDIIAKRSGMRYGIQCKYYSNPVGNKAVQEVFAGTRYYGCTKSAVLTNNTFTKSARALAERTGVELWEHNEIPYRAKWLGLSGWLGILACVLGLMELYLRNGDKPLAWMMAGMIPILKEVELLFLIAGGLCNVAHFHKWGIVLCGCLCYLGAALAGVLPGLLSDGVRWTGLIFYGGLLLASGVRAWRLHQR